MVLRMWGIGNETPKILCPNGHETTVIGRSSGMRRVCLRCLKDVFSGAASQSGSITVNDFLAALETGTHPRLSRADAEPAAAIQHAARELYGDGDAADCRKIVRDAAKANGVPAAAVMGWGLARFVSDGLGKLLPAEVF